MGTDGPDVFDLVANCPELDGNSLYCNVLQCTHFADTCALASGQDEVVGWASGYRLPHDPQTLFVWQVAVRHSARRRGLGFRLLTSILDRPSSQGIARIEATITSDNHASMGLFQRLANQLGGTIEVTEGFTRSGHFAGRHQTEMRVAVAPLA